MKILLAVLISALALSGAWAAQPRPKKKKPAPAAAAAQRVCKKCKRAVELFRYGFCQLCDPPIGYPKQKEKPKPAVIDPRTSGAAR